MKEIKQFFPDKNNFSLPRSGKINEQNFLKERVENFEGFSEEERKKYLIKMFSQFSFAQMSEEIIEIFEKAIGKMIEDKGEMDSNKDWGLSTADAERCFFDIVRTDRFKQAIDEVVQKEDIVAESNISAGDTVVEAGAGTGIIALMAAARGAKKVYAIEINPKTVKVCREFIKYCGFEDTIQILEGDATNFELPEDVDVIISENMYTGLLAEPQMQIIDNLKKFLKKGGKIIPEKFESYLELVIAQGLEENSIARNSFKGSTETVSKKIKFDEVDFNEQEPLDINKNIIIMADRDGEVNAVNISSLIQLTGDVDIKSNECDFLGQDEIIKLKKPINVETGKEYLVSIKFKAGDRPEDVFIEILEK